MKISKQTKGTLRQVCVVLAFILLAVFVAAACTQGFTNGNPWGWFGKDETPKVEASAGNAIVSPVEDDVKAMNIVVKKLAVSEYSDYGIMPIADTAFTIKASYTDPNVTGTELDWSIKWKSGASGQWGNGKTVTDYATISPSTDTLTLTITVKKAFGEQIIITATNRAVPTVTKSATLDYAKRLKSVSFSFEGAGGTATQGSTQYTFSSVVSGTDDAKMTTVTPKFTYADPYTVDDTFTLTKFEIAVNSDFATAFKAGRTHISGTVSGVSDSDSILDGIDTTEKWTSVTSLNSIPDVSADTALYTLLFGSAYTSATTQYATRTILNMKIKQVFSSFMSSNSDPFFKIRWEFSGAHSTFKSADDATYGSLGIGFATDAFGTLPTAGSLSFDHTSFVA